jgi:hypothetical protein
MSSASEDDKAKRPEGIVPLRLFFKLTASTDFYIFPFNKYSLKLQNSKFMPKRRDYFTHPNPINCNKFFGLLFHFSKIL